MDQALIFAALLDSRVDEVTRIGPPASYAAIANYENYERPLSSSLPTVLERFHFPDCHRELQGSTRLRLVPDRV